MARKKTTETKRPIESYEHKGKQRVNNPPVGLVTPDTDPDAGQSQAYAYDPHLDPQLQWAGKAEHTSFEVPTVSLHVHERIDPLTIIEAVRRAPDPAAPVQLALFQTPEENPPLREAIEFYQHAHGWSNRLVAGDSLLVMNSLLEKEGMAGKVQMVYLDPPYGIKYGSNFQPFVNKRDVKDGKDEDLTAEPEQIRAFRDTWELGIHSYLTYLRDRLLVAHELLNERGSCFVQISDENVHHVREVMDEIFGSDNFIAEIKFKTTGGRGGSLLDKIFNYIIWYGRNVERGIKYHQLFTEKDDDELQNYDWLESKDGTYSPLTSAHSRKGLTGRLYQLTDLTSQGESKEGYVFDYRGKNYRARAGRHWTTNLDGMKKLSILNRIQIKGENIFFKKYFEDFSVNTLSDAWLDTAMGGFRKEAEKIYVVQTTTRVIERCVLMTTDPGDLVFDPTCGSGTTAYVAEQWGRRWITCDTSRVALTLARTRLMTAGFDYYELAHPQEGVGSGFNYETVPHVTLKSIAHNEPPGTETLYDQPLVDRKKHRVSGPFTVEAVPAPAVKSVDDLLLPSPGGRGAGGEVARSGETLRQGEWRDELLRTGMRGKAGQYIRFARLEPLPGCRHLHADGETRPSDEGSDSVRERGPAYAPQRIVVSFGPQHAPLEQRQVAQAIEEAQTLVPRPNLIVFAAFQFDPEAAKDIDETKWPGVTLLKAQMNADLLTDDLKKKRASNESFWLIGQPDVAVNSEQWIVDSKKEALAPYGIIAKLSGVDSLAKINGLGRADLSVFIAIAQRRDLWIAVSTDKSGSVDSGKHRRGTGAAWDGGIPALPGHRAGFPGRIGDAGDFVREFGLLSERSCRERIERLRGSREIVDRARQIAAALTGPLSTIHYSQVTIHGFDYYNTKTGSIESGGAGQIAVWLLDTDYDGRSLYPRQVFFPQAGEGEGWARLANNLKAEIDEDLIEAYRGTESLPFAVGERKRIAVKIVDDRGIESLKVLEVGE